MKINKKPNITKSMKHIEESSPTRDLFDRTYIYKIQMIRVVIIITIVSLIIVCFYITRFS